MAHEYGSGVTKNEREAARWHSLAAAQGLAESDYHLGLMKAHGRGFAQDFSGAMIHFQKVWTQVPSFPSLCAVPCRCRAYGKTVDRFRQMDTSHVSRPAVGNTTKRVARRARVRTRWWTLEMNDLVGLLQGSAYADCGSVRPRI